MWLVADVLFRETECVSECIVEPLYNAQGTNVPVVLTPAQWAASVGPDYPPIPPGAPDLSFATPVFAASRFTRLLLEVPFHHESHSALADRHRCSVARARPDRLRRGRRSGRRLRSGQQRRSRRQQHRWRRHAAERTRAARRRPAR